VPLPFAVKMQRDQQEMGDVLSRFAAPAMGPSPPQAQPSPGGARPTPPMPGQAPPGLHPRPPAAPMSTGAPPGRPNFAAMTQRPGMQHPMGVRRMAEGGSVRGVDHGYGLREDGSLKGNGFYGMLPRTDHPGQRSSEFSVGLDLGDGVETSVPSMVPGLSHDQMQSLLSHDMPSQDILDKARSFAIQRRLTGLPYFARPQEENKLAVPRR
jgi:hypothetical protein